MVNEQNPIILLEEKLKAFENEKQELLNALNEKLLQESICYEVDVVSHEKNFNGTSTVYVKDSNSKHANWSEISFPVTFNSNKHQLHLGETGILTGSLYLSKSNQSVTIKLADFIPLRTFDEYPEKKSKLPFPASKHGEPLNVVVVTNKDSEAYKDVTEIFDKHPDDVHYKVESCVFGKFNKILRAVKKAIEERPDVILIARGGGSSSESTLFNHKELTNLILDSSIYTVTGIGHAGDLTYLDQIADLYCITPTRAASEIVRLFKDR